MRPLLFRAGFYAWTTLLSLLYLPLLLLPERAFMPFARFWVRGVLGWARVAVGLRHEVRGAKYLPQGPAIIASKHESAWETIALNLLIPNCCFIIKKELLSIPIFGWYLRKCGMIPVDRKAGAAALRGMSRTARQRLDAGRPIVIFPQGTRVSPGFDGAARPYQPGVVALAALGEFPVVPAALNSGLFWPAGGGAQRSGTITFELLPPLDPKPERRALIDALRDRIEAASAGLDAEAGAPHTPELYANKH